MESSPGPSSPSNGEQGCRTSGRQRTKPREFWRNENLGQMHVVPVLDFPEVNERRTPASAARTRAEDGPSTSGRSPPSQSRQRSARRLSKAAGSPPLPPPQRQPSPNPKRQDGAVRPSSPATAEAGRGEQGGPAERLEPTTGSPASIPRKGTGTQRAHPAEQAQLPGPDQAKLTSPERPQRAQKVKDGASPGKSPTVQLRAPAAERAPYQSPTRAAARARLAWTAPAATFNADAPPAAQPSTLPVRAGADPQRAPGRTSDASAAAPASRVEEKVAAEAQPAAAAAGEGAAAEAAAPVGAAAGGSPVKPARRRGDPVLTSVIMVRTQAPDFIDLTGTQGSSRGARKARAASAHAATGNASKAGKARPASAAAGVGASVAAAGASGAAVVAATAAAAAALVDSPLSARQQHDRAEAALGSPGAGGGRMAAADGRHRPQAGSAHGTGRDDAADAPPPQAAVRGRSKARGGGVSGAGAGVPQKAPERELPQRKGRPHRQQQQPLEARGQEQQPHERTAQDEDDVDDEEARRPSKRARRAAAPQPAAAPDPAARTRSSSGKAAGAGGTSARAPRVAAAAGAPPAAASAPESQGRATEGRGDANAGAQQAGAMAAVGVGAAPRATASVTSCGGAGAAAPAQPAASGLRRSSRLGPSSSNASSSHPRDPLAGEPARATSRGRGRAAAPGEQADTAALHVGKPSSSQRNEGAATTAGNGEQPQPQEAPAEGDGKGGKKRRRGKPPRAPASSAQEPPAAGKEEPEPAGQAQPAGAAVGPALEAAAAGCEPRPEGDNPATVAAAAPYGVDSVAGTGIADERRAAVRPGGWRPSPPRQQAAAQPGPSGCRPGSGQHTIDQATGHVRAAGDGEGGRPIAGHPCNAPEPQPRPDSPGAGQAGVSQRAGNAGTDAAQVAGLPPQPPLSPTESVAQNGALSPRQQRPVPPPPPTRPLGPGPGHQGASVRSDAHACGGLGAGGAAAAAAPGAAWAGGGAGASGSSMAFAAGGGGYAANQQRDSGSLARAAETSPDGQGLAQQWYGSPMRHARTVQPAQPFGAVPAADERQPWQRSDSHDAAGAVRRLDAAGPSPGGGSGVGGVGGVGYGFFVRPHAPTSPRSAAAAHADGGLRQGQQAGGRYAPGHVDESFQADAAAGGGAAGFAAWRDEAQQRWPPVPPLQHQYSQHQQQQQQEQGQQHLWDGAGGQQPQPQQERWQQRRLGGAGGGGEGALHGQVNDAGPRIVLGRQSTQDPYEFPGSQGDDPAHVAARDQHPVAQPRGQQPQELRLPMHVGPGPGCRGDPLSDRGFAGDEQLLGGPGPSGAGAAPPAPAGQDYTAVMGADEAQRSRGRGLPGSYPPGPQALSWHPRPPVAAEPDWQHQHQQQQQRQYEGDDAPLAARNRQNPAATGPMPQRACYPALHRSRAADAAYAGGLDDHGDAMDVDSGGADPGWQPLVPPPAPQQRQGQHRGDQHRRHQGITGEPGRSAAPPPHEPRHQEQHQHQQQRQEHQHDTQQHHRSGAQRTRHAQGAPQHAAANAALQPAAQRDDSRGLWHQSSPRSAAPIAGHSGAPQALTADEQKPALQQPQQPAFRVPALRAAVAPPAFRQQHQQQRAQDLYAPVQQPAQSNGAGASSRPAVNPLARAAVSLPPGPQPAGSSGAAASTAAKAASDSIRRALDQADEVARRNKTRSQEVVEREEDGWTLEQVQALQTAYFRVEPTHPHFWREVARQVNGKTAAECFARVFASGRDREERAALTKVLRRRPAAAAATGPGSGKPLTLAAARKWSQKAHEREQLELLARLGGVDKDESSGSEEEVEGGGGGAGRGRGRAGHGGTRRPGRRPQLVLPEDPTEMRRILDDMQQKHQADRFITSFLSKQGGWRKWHKAVREAQERHLRGLQHEQRAAGPGGAAAGAAAAAGGGGGAVAPAAAAGRAGGGGRAAASAAGARPEGDPLARVIRRMLAKDEAQQLRQMWREDDEAEGLDGGEYGAYDDEEEEDVVGGGAYRDDDEAGAEAREEEQLRRFLVAEGLLGPDGMPVFQ